jgi:hypothetical protein
MGEGADRADRFARVRRRSYWLEIIAVNIVLWLGLGLAVKFVL